MNDPGTGSEGRIAALEGQIEHLETQLVDLRRQLSEAELDQWRGRIDDLEIQAHLASLEVRGRLEPLIEDLRNAWLDAREAVSDGAASASDVATAVRHGLEQAMGEIRQAAIDARSMVKD